MLRARSAAGNGVAAGAAGFNITTALGRFFSIGVPSSATPRGMCAMGLRDSAETVEAIAEAYVNMELKTMRAFHELVAKQMQGPSGTNPMACEEMLLQGFGAGVAVNIARTAASAAGNSGGNQAAPVAAAPAAKRVVEKATVDVSVKSYPTGSKVKLIKELRAVTGVTLQEAKAAVEQCPGIVAKAVQRADAEKLKGLLEAHSAVVELL
ncbi:unnamed protein product [Trypanosoma congolense IL3000]|uniref:Uncharacterized protein TCIL3000_8_7310 n=1 Tax=Trypanosoma congolense (strain IL3000) TaxID=1068625 RepID=F9WI05_TRYCI|nr:unnamed protein product [Trypanosoma congolense IL3000]CCD16950.1 unnamed protein product [Trypanosoma congolense IL3000]